MKKIRLLAGVGLLVLMLLVLPSCGSGSGDEQSGEAEAAAGAYTNAGMTLNVPDEYVDLLVVETPKDSEDGKLFSVAEKASIESAAAQEMDTDGAGSLFDIGIVDEEDLRQMMTGDMSNAAPFAKDADGNYYVYYHPSDVRLIRSDNEEMDAAMDDWTKLNEWAWSMQDTFTADNGLTADKHSNTDLDIQLANIAYKGNTKYKISTTEFGPLKPNGVDPTSYVAPLINGVTYEEVDMAEAPDGEYVVLKFPKDKMRFDFFKAEGQENIIRQVMKGGDEIFYKAVFTDESLNATTFMEDWYQALAEAAGKTEQAAEE